MLVQKCLLLHQPYKWKEWAFLKIATCHCIYGQLQSYCTPRMRNSCQKRCWIGLDCSHCWFWNCSKSNQLPTGCIECKNMRSLMKNLPQSRMKSVWDFLQNYVKLLQCLPQNLMEMLLQSRCCEAAAYVFKLFIAQQKGCACCEDCKKLLRSRLKT